MRAPGEAPLGASSAAELGKLWRPRAQLGQPAQETSDPNLLARGNNPNISSLLHHPSEPTPSPAAKKTHFSAAARLRGLGCTAAGSQQVSVPAVIRASADWGRRKGKKKQNGFLQKNSVGNQGQLSNGSNFCCNSSGSCVVAEDAWCGPGIGLSAADADCVVVIGRRNVAMPAASREKTAAERLGQREVNASLSTFNYQKTSEILFCDATCCLLSIFGASSIDWLQILLVLVSPLVGCFIMVRYPWSLFTNLIFSVVGPSQYI